MPFGETATATFAVKFSKARSTRYEVSGAVRVFNTQPAPTEVARVAVVLEAAGGETQTVDAVCGGGGPFTVRARAPACQLCARVQGALCVGCEQSRPPAGV